MIKIEKKIISQKIKKPIEEVMAVKQLERPEVASGKTYKIKTPIHSAAIYITINSVEEEGIIRPFEVFITTKAVEIFQFMQVLGLTLTALIRMNQDITFLLEEYKTIKDPNGFYWGSSKTFTGKKESYNSLIANIADVILYHLKQEVMR